MSNSSIFPASQIPRSASNFPSSSRKDAKSYTHTSQTTNDSPMKPSTHGPSTGFANVDALQIALQQELRLHHYEGGEEYLDAAFKDFATHEDIDGFLDAHPNLYSYKTNSWTNITTDGNESTLYLPYLEVIEAILTHFGVAGRAVEHTSNISIKHLEPLVKEHADLHTSPDLAIVATSPCPMIQADSNTPIYANMVTPLEVKTEKNRSPLRNLLQIGVYARQSFAEQHNRRFVYSTIMTESHIQLFQFDRSGVISSSRSHIHKDPHTFIRLILGLSSDPETVGYDSSIFWQNGRRYMRIKNFDGKGVVVCEIEPIPLFSRRTIRGRGTCCWRLLMGERKVIAKESWSSVHRQHQEWQLLEHVKGSCGVGHMIGDAETGPTTANHRWIKLQVPESEAGVTPIFLPGKEFEDRSWCRIFLDEHGTPIEGFETRKELLCAFRDAVNGHRNMLKNRVLHRDVSINNILIGDEGCESKSGNCGVLIDLDMAILLPRSRNSGGFRTGTRAFQSIAVLLGEKYDGKDSFPHDYLDDLESFFYVLCWICFSYNGPRQPYPKRPDFLAEWEVQNASSAANAKDAFLIRNYRHEIRESLSPWFGPVFTSLLTELRGFILDISMIKSQIDYPEGEQELADYLSHPDNHYDKFLGFVIKAINALKDTDPQPPPLPPPLPPPPEISLEKTVSLSRGHSNTSDRTSRKRVAIEELTEGEPRPKRAHSSRSQSNVKINPSTTKRGESSLPRRSGRVRRLSEKAKAASKSKERLP